ncbi:MAG: hypothetical protein NT062_06485 [Proteobacteria bacterium]|nr:hypothetical protein [Pseudomonadota bacterium]
MLLRLALPIAALGLLACGKPLRNFGDGGLPDAGFEIDAPILEPPPIDAACTNLATTAPDIVAQNPAPPWVDWIGGMITDGTYVLVTVDQYNATGNPVYRDTIRFVGAGTADATYERATLSGVTTGSWSVNGGFNILLLTPTCGAPSISTNTEYNFVTATGVFELIDYVGTVVRVYTYQRQP